MSLLANRRCLGAALAGLCIAVALSGTIWLTAQSGRTGKWHLYKRTGSRWSRLAIPRNYRIDVNRPLSYDGRDGFWQSAYHWTGKRWIDTAAP